MTCPKCHSDEWKLASIVHAGGLSTISTSTVGVGGGASADIFGGGVGLGAGVGSTTGTQQTALSKLAAPPEKEMRPATAFICLGGIILLGGVLLIRSTIVSEHPIFFFVFPLLIIVIGILRILFTPGVARDLKEKRNGALLEYARKRMCLRCGTIYLHSDQAGGPEFAGFVATESKPHVSTIRKCPFCAETILSDAILCKHCHSKVDPAPIEAAREASKFASQTKEPSQLSLENTDRTAAELALKRLKSELAAIDLKLANPLSIWKVKLDTAPAGTKLARFFFFATSFLALLMVVFLIIIVTSSRADEGRSAEAIQFFIGFVIIAGISAPKSRLGELTNMEALKAPYVSQREEILRRVEMNRTLLNK
jgi:hypothetical protein